MAGSVIFTIFLHWDMQYQ